MPVTRTLSDLDTHKESRWASRTSSSNSLASVRALGPSDTDPQFYPIPSAEYLQSEIVRLRQQLQLSREDAARAANRLSQQETELANLRHMLEHMRTKPVGSNVTVQLGVMKNSALNSAGRVRNESSQRTGVGAVSGSNVNRSQTSNRKPNNDPQLVRNSSCALTPAPGATKSVIGSSASSTTFEELDDAMAKLEREQNELMREQARIRARLAASRPAVSASATRTKPRLSSNSKSTNTPLRSPKLSLNITSTNHFLGSEVARSSGTGLSNAGDGSTPCGPRIRHGPPPKPRDTASARYAY
ncbi:hypothetical protein FBUS_07826 [Fasciolopsis buskii]|uniref:Uncharacterized protein n=1 Tax=Fasciolopsis buskii TaxID=27845 RepID=A0A8E0S1K0_9TREM|nr:hypothetical protein FBUS_07826 [Fasciolopsis buski]